MRRSIVFRPLPVLIALAATASLGWAAAPAVAQAAPPNDNYLSSTIIPQGSTTGRSLIRYTDTETLTIRAPRGSRAARHPSTGRSGR